MASFEERDEKSLLGKQLVRLERGRFYIGMIQFILILILTVRTFNTEKLLGISPTTATIISLPLGVAGIWIIGYVDDKFGVFSSYQDYITGLNPKFKEIYEKLDEVEREVKSEESNS